MSQLSVALQKHAGATSILAGILRGVLNTLPIQPNEKAGMMQAVQEVEDTANGLHHSFATEAADVGTAFVSGAEVSPVAEPGLATTPADLPPIVKPIETPPSAAVETAAPSTAAPVSTAMTPHQQAVAEELAEAREAFERAQANAASVGVPT